MSPIKTSELQFSEETEATRGILSNRNVPALTTQKRQQTFGKKAHSIGGQQLEKVKLAMNSMPFLP